MRLVMMSAASILIAGLASETTYAIQAAPADGYLTPIGAQNPSQGGQPFRLATRDENGNRIIINGRPVSASGSTLSQGGSFGSGGSFAFGTMRSTSNGTTLSQSTLSAVSIGNSVSINNVRNSTIVINQTNSGEVSAAVNSNAVANDNAGGSN